MIHLLSLRIHVSYICLRRNVIPIWLRSPCHQIMTTEGVVFSKSHEMSRKLTESHKKSRNLLKTHGILQNPPESMEFHWNLLIFFIIYNEIYRTWCKSSGSVPYVAANPDDYSFLNLLVKHCQQDAGLWNTASNTYAIWGYFGSLFKKQNCQEGRCFVVSIGITGSESWESFAKHMLTYLVFDWWNRGGWVFVSIF